MTRPHDAKTSARMLSAIAEATRLLALVELAHGPQSVGELAENLGVAMVNMSHHLGVMKAAGIVEDTKVGRRRVYSLRPDVFTPGDGKSSLCTLRLGGVVLSLDALPGGKPAGRSR